MLTISDKRQLFNELSIACNSLDVESVKQFYYGFMRYVIRETKKRGSLSFPDFGTFRIVNYKPRMARDVRSNCSKWVPASVGMKFKPDYKVNLYIRDQL